MADDFNVLDQAAGGGDLAAERFGLKFSSIPSYAAVVKGALASGVAVYVLTRVPVACTITHLGVWVAQVAATDGGDNNMGVYTQAGARLGVTAEMDLTALGYREGELSAPLSLAAGSYYLHLITHYTTAPQVACTATGIDRLAVNAVRPSVFHTSQTSSPSSITPGSLTVDSAEYFFGAR